MLYTSPKIAPSTDNRRRWLALLVLCLGALMIVLDTTIVNVALPSIRQDLGFSETSLVWVVNAYMLSFGGFLLLGGRLGDLFGHRRLFLLGNSLLWAAAMFAWFFISALYLQLVLGSSPMQVGLAFLPANLIMAAFLARSVAKLVMRFGNRRPLAFGLLLAAAGLALFARAPVDGSFMVDVLPGMTLLGLGAGMALNPLLLVAMGDVSPSESGLASGVVNTAFMMGGALGLAVLASVAAARTESLLALGIDMPAALTGGYHAAFLAGALFAAVAALLGAVLLRGAHARPRRVRGRNVGFDLQKIRLGAPTIKGMKNPIKLVIDEPAPGSYIWTLLETDAGGAPRKVLRSAEYGADTYEAALAAGTRMMDAEIRKNVVASSERGSV